MSLSVNFGFETIFGLGLQKNIDAGNISSAVRILGRWEGAELTWAAIPSDLEAWTCYPRTCKCVWGWINYDSWNNYDRGKAAAENTVDSRGWFDLILSCQSMHLFARLHENAVFKESSVFCFLSTPCTPPKKKKECFSGLVVVAQGLSCSAACGSSRTRDQTRVPCIGRLRGVIAC